MESVNDIKSALSERSRTATLDELRDEGRRRVRLIRAEHVAQMISEAVHAAIEHSGLVDADEVEKLVEQSRREFKAILNERETELREARENEQRLEQKEGELAGTRTRIAELSKSLAEAREQLEQARGELEQLRAAPPAPAAAPAAAPSAAQPLSGDMVMTLMQELASLKASVAMQQQQPGTAAPAADAPAAPAGGGAELTAMLEKLAGSLNDRLEKFGRKMGISAAVEGDAQVDFSGMFDGGESNLESNMDNIKVKQKAGGGIAANLARLKKLKGGG